MTEEALGVGSGAFVYVLYRENGYGTTYSKVGSTTLSAGSRANDYTDGGWQVFDEMPIHPAIRYHVERQSHEILKCYWLDPSMTGGTAREIFTCSPEEAVKAVREAYKKSSINIIKSVIRDNPDIMEFAKIEYAEAKHEKHISDLKSYHKDSQDSLNEVLKSLRREVATLRSKVLDLEAENTKLKGIYFE